MTTRTIQQIIPATDHEVAPGLTIKRPIPATGLKNLDPFLLLDHFGPTKVAPDTRNEVPDHPHKGFEPVTLIFSGKGNHKDSLGNDLTIRGGDVGWMTAGKGIVHYEGFGPDPDEEEATIHGIQLWVNLPIAHKYAEPRYQHTLKKDMPLIKGEGWQLKLIAGALDGQQSPVKTYSPLLLASVETSTKTQLSLPVPADWQAGIYVMQGAIAIEEQSVGEKELAVLSHGDQVTIHAKPKSHFLLLSGEPLNERIASYGPFVMTNMREVLDAIEEYQTGKMGTISHQS